MLKQFIPFTRDIFMHAYFWSSLFYAASYPTMHKTIIGAIDARLLAIQGTALYAGVIFVNLLYTKYAEDIFRWFPFYATLEALVETIGVALVLTRVIDYTTFFIIGSLNTMFLSKNLTCSLSRLKRLRYKDEKRELLDNTTPIAIASASILGGGINIILPLTIPTAFCCACLGGITFSVFNIIAYRQTTR